MWMGINSAIPPPPTSTPSFPVPKCAPFTLKYALVTLPILKMNYAITQETNGTSDEYTL